MRAAQYFGGKGGAIARWISSQFPHHTTYVEPFGGLASVLLNKKRSQFETYNELSLATVNFMLVVKWDVEQLIQEIYYAIETLTTEQIKSLPVAPEIDDKELRLQRAAQFYLHCEMSFMGGGLRWSSGLSPSATRPDPLHLHQVSDRLQSVDIEWKDAFTVIESYDRAPETLFYCDPPYLNSARKSKDNRVVNPKQSLTRRQYLHELTEAQHIQLRNCLEGRSAIVSGYKSELYEELYQGWEVRSRTYAGDTEYLWISPVAMNQMEQLSIGFAIG